MSKENNLTDFLTDIANTLRTQTNTTATINPQNFSTMISNDLVGKAWVEGKYLPLTGGNLSGDLKTFGSIILTNDTGYEKITITRNSITDERYGEQPLTYSNGALSIYGSITSPKLKAISTEGTITIGEDIEFAQGSHLTGISDSTGDSSTIAVSQKCLNDNYLAKSDVTYSTTDLTAGTSPLATGSFYFVYE